MCCCIIIHHQHRLQPSTSFRSSTSPHYSQHYRKYTTLTTRKVHMFNYLIPLAYTIAQYAIPVLCVRHPRFCRLRRPYPQTAMYLSRRWLRARDRILSPRGSRPIPDNQGSVYRAITEELHYREKISRWEAGSGSWLTHYTERHMGQMVLARSSRTHAQVVSRQSHYTRQVGSGRA